MLEKHATDPIALDAALSGLRGAEVTVLENLLQRTTSTAQAETAITMLAATIVRGAQDSATQELFQRVSEDARPEWQRSALLRGAEVALLGAAMPGKPAGRGGWAAREPLAAAMFQRPRRANAAVRAEPGVPSSGWRCGWRCRGRKEAAGRGGGRGGGPGLRLNTAPALYTLAHGW